MSGRTFDRVGTTSVRIRHRRNERYCSRHTQNGRGMHDDTDEKRMSSISTILPRAPIRLRRCSSTSLSLSPSLSSGIPLRYDFIFRAPSILMKWSTVPIAGNQQVELLNNIKKLVLWFNSFSSPTNCIGDRGRRRTSIACFSRRRYSLQNLRFRTLWVTSPSSRRGAHK